MDSSFAMGSVQIAHGDFLDIDIGPNHFWLGFSLGDRMSGLCCCGGVTEFHLDSTCRTDPVIEFFGNYSIPMIEITNSREHYSSVTINRAISP